MPRPGQLNVVGKVTNPLLTTITVTLEHVSKDAEPGCSLVESDRFFTLNLQKKSGLATLTWYYSTAFIKKSDL